MITYIVIAALAGGFGFVAGNRSAKGEGAAALAAVNAELAKLKADAAAAVKKA